jgi:ubiquinone/menaquinone biosynthesis C-methylase UbiE
MTTAEGDAQRDFRLRRRVLFDEVAELYAATRPGYPPEIVDDVISAAGLQPGSAVLEIACGTGQLTASLAGRGFALTAIDIGPSMVAAAQRALGPSAATFLVTSFEDLDAPAGSFDLIVCATAFHWIDPAVRFTKAARLLRPGGWLALLSTGEGYDDPVGAALRQMWIDRSPDGGAWARHAPPKDAELIHASGLFEPAIKRDHMRRTTMPVDAMLGLENTRSNSLSWPPEERAEFTAQLRQVLAGRAEVELTQHTGLAMARLAAAREG